MTDVDGGHNGWTKQATNRDANQRTTHRSRSVLESRFFVCSSPGLRIHVVQRRAGDDVELPEYVWVVDDGVMA
jgi:hypothetical protein